VADQSVPAPSEEALPATRIDTTPAAAPKAECEAGTFPKFEPVDSAPLDSRVTNELAALRSLLEGQFAQLAWSDSLRRTPLRAQLTQELMTVGYSPGLAREITQRLPDDYTPAQAQQWLMGVMSKNVRCVDSSDDIVSRGGVYALVGPTGVGKTTTTAKLAARCAVRHGSASLALLTTDSYRVGAHDHLRIYAKILGVSVQTVNDARDLRQAVDALQSKHLVLIDTVGMGQRDARVAEHSAMLAQPDVRRLLLLNAASQSETLEEVVAAYGARDTNAASGHRGCIITKQDESARPGQVLDVIIRHQLQLHYVSNGQRVPEDLQTANAGYLVHRSFKQLAQVSAFRLQRHEVPLMLAARGAIHV
jgi:flagellar biosynthesis protein FlhF